jgi:hypothetical protein
MRDGKAKQDDANQDAELVAVGNVGETLVPH